MLRFAIGIFVILGTVGREDFWLECATAADCVAGPPPSMVVTIMMYTIGLALMAWPFVDGSIDITNED
jgi:hypothetical protein